MLYSARSMGFSFFAITIGMAGTAAIAEREAPAVETIYRIESRPFLMPFEPTPETRTQPWARLLGVVEMSDPRYRISEFGVPEKAPVPEGDAERR